MSEHWKDLSRAKINKFKKLRAEKNNEYYIPPHDSQKDLNELLNIIGAETLKYLLRKLRR